MPLAACICSPLNLKGACPRRRGDQRLTNSHAATSFFNYRQQTRRNLVLFTGAASASARPLNNKGGFFLLNASFSGITTSQIVTSVFGVGTAAVLPFYALMVFAPKTTVTKKTSESSFPYVALGLVYAYLLYLSWTPDSVKLIFSGQYLLPEISGITKLFSSEMTLASAWIHLLVVDLFAARQIFHDGLENQVETRHSVSLCLFCCPLGIFMHFITKALTGPAPKTTP